MNNLKDTREYIAAALNERTRIQDGTNRLWTSSFDAYAEGSTRFTIHVHQYRIPNGFGVYGIVAEVYFKTSKMKNYRALGDKQRTDIKQAAIHAYAERYDFEQVISLNPGVPSGWRRRRIKHVSIPVQDGETLDDGTLHIVAEFIDRWDENDIGPKTVDALKAPVDQRATAMVAKSKEGPKIAVHGRKATRAIQIAFSRGARDLGEAITMAFGMMASNDAAVILARHGVKNLFEIFAELPARERFRDWYGVARKIGRTYSTPVLAGVHDELDVMYAVNFSTPEYCGLRRKREAINPKAFYRAMENEIMFGEHDASPNSKPGKAYRRATVAGLRRFRLANPEMCE